MSSRCLAVLGMLGCCVSGGPAVVSAGPPGDGWKLVFCDEFDGTDADLDANWEFQNGPSGHILCSRWRDNAMLDDGLLKLIARKEQRGGQDWTAASLWTRKRFKYGYFECRYRYAPATGTNNSFWIMTRGKPAQRFEIDINEGHWPNEVNMNLHNHSGKHWAKGGRWYYGEQGPGETQQDAGFNFILDRPIMASRVRFVSDDPEAVRVMELRLFAPSSQGYPSVFPNTTEAQPTAVNLALEATAVASSELHDQYLARYAVDGQLSTASRWVSDYQPGPHTLTLSFDTPREIGCLQFISGWQEGHAWRGIVHDFRFEYRDGHQWLPVPGASRTALTGVDRTAAAGAHDLGRSFHTYALEWNPNELVYYFDGQPIRRQTHDICRGEAAVWLSLAVIKWAGAVTDAIDGTSMDVDYVKVWQRTGSSRTDAAAKGDSMNLNAMIQPVPKTARFGDPEYYIWGGSLAVGDDGRYHMYYSRWLRRLGFSAWVTHSEIAHAVADSPTGPFRHVAVALPARGKEFWDGLCTHNPTIQRFDGRYYLYYMGNTGDGKSVKGLNWTHRNNQRIGVAVADSPDGPWTRFDKPVIDVSADPEAPDSLCTTNPSITRRPDGGYLMVYKAVGRARPLPFGGPVVHLTATADSPTGPFTKQLHPVFTRPGDDFPAEDPYVWYQASDQRYYAIVKDHRGVFTDAGKSLALFESGDGFAWRLSAHPLVSKTEVTWTDGAHQTLNSLERPQLFVRNGVPTALLCAANEDRARPRSFNIQIPLRPAADRARQD